MPHDPLPVHVQARVDARDCRLAVLGFASYREYLQSDRWRATKARYRGSALAQECVCGDEDTHLHHLTYERLGNESLSDLMPLCRRCHAMVHVLERQGRIGLDLDGFELDADRAAEGRAFIRDLVESCQRAREEAVRTERAQVLALSFASRLLRAVAAAKANHRDVKQQIWLLKQRKDRGASARSLTRGLRVVEERAYGWDGWADQLEPPASREAA